MHKWTRNCQKKVIVCGQFCIKLKGDFNIAKKQTYIFNPQRKVYDPNLQ